MQLIPTSLPGVVILRPVVHADDRGFLLEAFHADRFAALGLPAAFVQDNRVRSRRGVVRGLHFQLRRPQGKLITVTRGEIFDVVVDIRRGSPSFGRWATVPLSADDPRMLWVPPGCAHGYAAMADVVDVSYKCTAPYDPSDDRGIRWNDPALAIAWPVSDPIVSPRDACLPLLGDASIELPEYAS